MRSDTAEISVQIGSLGDQVNLLAASLDALMHTRVLEVGTWQFDATGIITRSFHVPYASVSVISRSGQQIVVSSGPPGASTPTSGMGTGLVGPYGTAVIPMAGRVVTLYGTPGDSVTVGVYATQQPPAAVPGYVTAATPATVDLYTEALVAGRTASGNLPAAAWPAGVTAAFVGVNITAYAGGTNVVIQLQQQDANGQWQTIATSAALTATGTANFSVGPGTATGALLRSGGQFRLAWVLTGVFTTLTFQLAVTAR